MLSGYEISEGSSVQIVGTPDESGAMRVVVGDHQIELPTQAANLIWVELAA
jgi:hypothetical protein